MSIDPYHLFRNAVEKSIEYPSSDTVVRTAIFGHAMASFVKRLKTKKVFHDSYRSLGFVDLHEGSQAFHPVRKIDTVEKLRNHLNDDVGAPLWRMVFLKSKSSRSALGCSGEQLSLLLTYYQVMPSFLDLVLTFEPRHRPVNRAMFRHEDFLTEDAEPFALPGLGRSGMVMQHAFNLLSMEYSDSPGSASNWFQRQVAMYHSFDVQNGRSLWIVLKGNSLIDQRFLASTGRHRQLKAEAIHSRETSFVAALHMHLMVVDWCVEEWGTYIDHLDGSLEGMSADARMAHVDEATQGRNMAQTYESRRANTMSSQTVQSRQSTFAQSRTQSLKSPTSSEPPSPTTPRTRTFTRSFSDLIPAMRRLSTLKSHRAKGSWPGDVESGLMSAQQDGGDDDDDDDDEDEAQDQFDDEGELEELSKDFSFKRFQRLNNLGDDVEQARVAIEQNRGVLKELRLHYKDTFCSHSFKMHIQVDKCQGEFAAFDRKVESVERELDVHHCRLDSLARALDNEKVMFASILQYKSEKTNEFFASSAKKSSDRMEQWTDAMHKIAVKTEQETVSMHVITVFTLIFLPGTFLAVRYLCQKNQQLFSAKDLTLPPPQTFFSSGILDWDDDNLSSYGVRGGAMRLFFYICVPMMLLILLGWYLLYRLAQIKGRKRINEVLEEVNAGLHEASEESSQGSAKAKPGSSAQTPPEIAKAASRTPCVLSRPGDEKGQSH